MKSTFLAASVAVGVLTICGCSSGNQNSANATASPALATVTNGEMIFQTGKDSAGKQITAAKPPLRPSCAACHNANGSGGVKFKDGAVSADLRYAALVTKQKTPYTLTLLQRAISTGVDNEGKPLDAVMPHWRLSKTDLHDVAVYVSTLK